MKALKIVQASPTGPTHRASSGAPYMELFPKKIFLHDPKNNNVTPRHWEGDVQRKLNNSVCENGSNG